MEPTDMRWLNPLNHQAMEGRHGSSGSSVDGGAGGGAGGHGGGVPRLVLSDGRSVTIYERHNNKDTTFKDKAKKGINPTKVAKHKAGAGGGGSGGMWSCVAVASHVLPFNCLTDDVITHLLLNEPTLQHRQNGKTGPTPAAAISLSRINQGTRGASGGGTVADGGAGGDEGSDGFTEVEEGMDPRSLLALMCCAMTSLTAATSPTASLRSTGSAPAPSSRPVGVCGHAQDLAEDCAWQVRSLLVHLGSQCQAQAQAQAQDHQAQDHQARADTHTVSEGVREGVMYGERECYDHVKCIFSPTHLYPLPRLPAPSEHHYPHPPVSAQRACFGLFVQPSFNVPGRRR